MKTAPPSRTASKVFLTVHGVGGHDTFGQPEFGEQALNRRDFVLLLADFDVAEDQGGGRVERADQMDGGTVGEVIETPAQRLAVEGDDPNAFAADLVGQNGSVDAEDPLQLARIKRLCSTSRIEV